MRDVPGRIHTSPVIVLLLLIAALSANTYALDESTGSNGSNAQAAHQLDITGRGVNIGLISGRNALDTHYAFYDKDQQGYPVGDPCVINYDYSGDGISVSSHDTYMAGIMVSRGDANHPQCVGAAPGARLHIGRVADANDDIYSDKLEQALDELVELHGCDVLVPGFSVGGIADGNSVWSLMYDYYAFQYDVVLIAPAGNSDSCIDILGDCYNALTTGGLVLSSNPAGTSSYLRVGTISGSGPTTDGRYKPELTAPSQDQTVPAASSNHGWNTIGGSAGLTSYAVPHVAGTAAVLLEEAKQSEDPRAEHNEVIRAIMVNSAFSNIDDKNGNWTDPAYNITAWNPERGFGRVDAGRALFLLRSGSIDTDTTINRTKGWGYELMGPNQQVHYLLEGSRNCRLTVTLAWNRKVTRRLGGYSAESEPSFSLELEIVNPDGETIFSSSGYTGNLVKYDRLLAVDGVYELFITNRTSKNNRGYGLAFELIEPLNADIPPLDYTVDWIDLRSLAGCWDTGTGPADLDDNGLIDLADLSLLAGQWMEYAPAYCRH